MDDPGAVRLTIDVQAGEPIHGHVTPADGHWRPFSGWLELGRHLEAARVAAGAPPADDGAQRVTRREETHS